VDPLRAALAATADGARRPGPLARPRRVPRRRGRARIHRVAAPVGSGRHVADRSPRPATDEALLRPLRDEEEALASSWAESLKQKRRAEGEPDPEDAASPRSLCALIEGFSLHAATRVDASDRRGLEHLLRYGARRRARWRASDPWRKDRSRPTSCPSFRRGSTPNPAVTPETNARRRPIREKGLDASYPFTEFGRVALRYADEIFTLGREFMDTAKGRPSGRPLRLVVGIPDVLPKSAVYRILAPVFLLGDIRVICREGRSAAEFMGELAMHTIDVVLSDTPAGPGTSARVFSHPLGECGTAFFAAPALAKACRAPVPAFARRCPLSPAGRELGTSPGVGIVVRLPEDPTEGRRGDG